MTQEETERTNKSTEVSPRSTLYHCANVKFEQEYRFTATVGTYTLRGGGGGVGGGAGDKSCRWIAERAG
jgi:hypothetical protein